MHPAPLVARLVIGDDPRPAVERGEAVTVEGLHFVDGCNDDGVMVTYGCRSHQQPPEPVEPMTDVTLFIRQDGRTWTLGSANADANGRVTWAATLPSQLAPGRAVLLSGPAERLRVVVRE